VGDGGPEGVGGAEAGTEGPADGVGESPDGGVSEGPIGAADGSRNGAFRAQYG
jgi:hypothetical protein